MGIKTVTTYHLKTAAHLIDLLTEAGSRTDLSKVTPTNDNPGVYDEGEGPVWELHWVVLDDGSKQMRITQC